MHGHMDVLHAKLFDLGLLPRRVIAPATQVNDSLDAQRCQALQSLGAGLRAAIDVLIHLMEVLDTRRFRFIGAEHERSQDSQRQE